MGSTCYERNDGYGAMATDWDHIYRESYPALVRFLYRKMWDSERAHELAQDVFVRALHHEPDRPRPWLFVTAANLARDESRGVLRRKRHLALLTNDSGLGDSPVTPETQLLESEDRRRVREALATLGERDQEVLLLWDGGLSYSEISAEAGLAVSAVGTTLSRARKRLVESFDRISEVSLAKGGSCDP